MVSTGLLRFSSDARPNIGSAAITDPLLQVTVLSKEIVERVLPDTPEPKSEEEAKAQMSKSMS